MTANKSTSVVLLAVLVPGELMTKNGEVIFYWTTTFIGGRNKLLSSIELLFFLQTCKTTLKFESLFFPLTDVGPIKKKKITSPTLSCSEFFSSYLSIYLSICLSIYQKIEMVLPFVLYLLNISLVLS